MRRAGAWKTATAAAASGAAAMLFAACLAACFGPDRVAGGGSETEYISLTGVITLPDGGAAAGCRIAVRPAGYLYDPEFPPGKGERDTLADAKGEFSLRDLAAGEYTVEAYLGDTLGFAARVIVPVEPEPAPGSGPAPKAPGYKLEGALQRTGSLTVQIGEAKPDLDYYIQAYGLKRRVLADSAGMAKAILPPGEFRIRIISSSKDLAPAVYSEIVIRSGADTLLPAVFLQPADGAGADGGAVPLIFDSNIGFAFDDAAALTLLHALADRGEARVLATGTTNPTFSSPAILDVINTYHGRGAVPVGAWKGEAADTGNGYDRQVASEFPHDQPAWEAIPSAASVYRKALEGQADASAVIVCTGDVRNAWALLRASKALVARKVKALVLVGGRYPSGREFNFAAAIARDTLPNMIREVVESWPTPVHFIGQETGEDIASGACLATAATGGPLKRIYDLNLGPTDPIKPSTDLLGLLYAVRGASTGQASHSLWSMVAEGGNTVQDDGSNVWSPLQDTDQAYLLRNGGPEALGAALDALLCAIPKP
jgi:pyrimidine-specific ribonucleoside hydrolase